MFAFNTWGIVTSLYLKTAGPAENRNGMVKLSELYLL
jgi:hypothetical protein